jgi:hypothetical protein
MKTVIKVYYDERDKAPVDLFKTLGKLGFYLERIPYYPESPSKLLRSQWFQLVYSREGPELSRKSVEKLKSYPRAKVEIEKIYEINKRGRA